MKEKEFPYKTETEYWDAHKKWSRKFNKLLAKPHRIATSGKDYTQSFMDLLEEGVEKQIVTKEWKNQQIEKFNRELTSPTRFNTAVKNKIEKAKEKFKRKNESK